MSHATTDKRVSEGWNQKQARLLRLRLDAQFHSMPRSTMASLTELLAAVTCSLVQRLLRVRKYRGVQHATAQGHRLPP
jgi:hypothetical protein